MQDLLHPIPALQHRFEAHGICVIIPTYNNCTTLAKVVQDVQQYTTNIIIVNDGSTDETPAILAALHGPVLISYPKNVGKGWALRKGFEMASREGYEYAITIDSDGQHFASDLHAFVDKLDADGPALIIGARNMAQDGIPSKSSFGHKFSNFWFWVETGVRAPDTQSGYRLYPLRPLRKMYFFTRKYEFEIEVLVRAAWSGARVSSVPIAVYYAPAKERITHFRPFTDFSRISVLNTILVIITILYIKPKQFLVSLFKKETYIEFWAQVFNAEESKEHKAISIAFGVFMGIVPIWGFQLVAAIFLAVFFKLNRYLVILSANISLPPMIPAIIYLSYVTGSYFVDKPIQLAYHQNLSVAAIHQNFVQYFIGSWIFASVAAIVAGLVTYIMLHLYQRRNRLATTHG